jgi:hypothetical protein
MTEVEEIAALSLGARRYLARRQCVDCGLPLNLAGCASAGQLCPAERRAERRRECLAGYRPQDWRRYHKGGPPR